MMNIVRANISYFNLLIFFSCLVSSRAIDNKTEDNVNRNLNEVTPMENDQSTSIVSQSQIDDDIVEIEGLLESSSNVGI